MSTDFKMRFTPREMLLLQSCVRTVLEELQGHDKETLEELESLLALIKTGEDVVASIYDDDAGHNFEVLLVVPDWSWERWERGDADHDLLMEKTEEVAEAAGLLKGRRTLEDVYHRRYSKLFKEDDEQ